MFSGLKPWFALVGVLAGVLTTAWAIHAYRYRWVHSDRDLVSLLPHDRSDTVWFANVALLREAGLLRFLAGVRDSEYKAFEESTGFDYTRDLDTLAGASDGTRTYFVTRGRFDAGRIYRYAETHGGGCDDKLCRMPGTRSGSSVSLVFIQPDVLAIAVAADRSAAAALSPHQRHAVSRSIPADPIWVEVASSLFNNPGALPLALRVFAISLQPADSVLLALNRPNPAIERVPFTLQLRATCANPATARTIRSQLELQTGMLKLELAREHQTANAGDLTGLLTAGSFSTSDREVVGNWPVQSALLATLQ